MFFKHLLLPNGLSGILRCEVFFDFGIFLLYEKRDNKYGDGFNVILEDIINKYLTKSTKDKNYIKKMNIIFNGSSSI